MWLHMWVHIRPQEWAWRKKKVMGYFHSVSPQLFLSSFLCSFILPLPLEPSHELSLIFGLFTQRCLYIPTGLNCIDCNFCWLLHGTRKSMEHPSAWQEADEKWLCERGGERSKWWTLSWKKHCFVNKYVICQGWQTLEYPRCGKSFCCQKHCDALPRGQKIPTQGSCQGQILSH